MTQQDEQASSAIAASNDDANTTETPNWAKGVPTRLLRKVNIIPQSESSLPVYTLTFQMPDPSHPNFSGPAVHHSKVRMDMGDVVKMVIPGYKPKSYSISELRRDEFDVTLKVYPHGRASGCLDRLQVGDCIQSFGKHAARTRHAGRYVGLVVFGVGMTEGLPLAMAELQKGDAVKVVLLWASRTMEDTFWRDKMIRLKQDHGDKLDIVFLLSRQEPPDSDDNIRYLHGRINPDLLKQVFQPTNAEEARFLSVGTKEMMKIADDMLTDIGFPIPEQHLLPKIK
jgi:NAD(P)H-flavin reductase